MKVHLRWYAFHSRQKVEFPSDSLLGNWATIAGHQNLGSFTQVFFVGHLSAPSRAIPRVAPEPRDACLGPFPHPRRLFSRDTSRPFDPGLAGPSPARAHPGEACPPATTALTTGQTHMEEHRHRRHPVHRSPMNCSSSARRSPSRLLPNRSRSRIIRASRCSWAVPSR